MRRIAFLRGALAGLASLVVETTDERLLPAPGRHGVAPADALTEERLAELERQAEELRGRCRSDGRVRYTRDLVRQADQAAELFAVAPPWHPLRGRAALTAASACYVVGHAFVDRLRVIRAQQWFAKSAEYAVAAGSLDLRILAECGTAHADVQGRMPGRAIARLSPMETGGPDVQSHYVAIELALTHAANGDDYEAMSALDRADSYARQLAHEPPSPVLGRPSEDQTWHWRGYAAARLGHTREAKAAIARSYESLPDDWRCARGELVCELASVFAHEGEVERSVDLLSSAWVTAKATFSRKNLLRALEVRAQLPDGAASVRALDELMRAS
jgi:hypothetical protein